MLLLTMTQLLGSMLRYLTTVTESVNAKKKSRLRQLRWWLNDVKKWHVDRATLEPWAWNSHGNWVIAQDSANPILVDWMGTSILVNQPWSNIHQPLTKIHQLVCFPSFIISGVNLRAFGNPKKAQTVWLRHLQPTYALPWMNWELSLLWGVKTNQLSGICGLGKLWFPKFLAHVFDVNGKLTNQQKIEFSEGYLE